MDGCHKPRPCIAIPRSITPGRNVRPQMGINSQVNGINCQSQSLCAVLFTDTLQLYTSVSPWKGKPDSASSAYQSFLITLCSASPVHVNHWDCYTLCSPAGFPCRLWPLSPHPLLAVGGRKDTDKGYLCSLIRVQFSSKILLVWTLPLGLIKTPSPKGSSPQYSHKLLVHHWGGKLLPHPPSELFLSAAQAAVCAEEALLVVVLWAAIWEVKQEFQPVLPGLLANHSTGSCFSSTSCPSNIKSTMRLKKKMLQVLQLKSVLSQLCLLCSDLPERGGTGTKSHLHMCQVMQVTVSHSRCYPFRSNGAKGLIFHCYNLLTSENARFGTGRL